MTSIGCPGFSGRYLDSCQGREVHHRPRAQRRAPSLTLVHRPKFEGLTISGSRPASASGHGARELQRPWEIEKTLHTTEHSAAPPVDDTPTAISSAGAGMTGHSDGISTATPLRLLPLSGIGLAVKGQADGASTATPSRLLPLSSTGHMVSGEWQDIDMQSKPDVFTFSLVSVAGQRLGAVTLHSEAQALGLRALFSDTQGGGQSTRSTVEFWDGDVAGSAEGVLSITERSKSVFEITHNFLELSRVDDRATLSFEDMPDMRIVIEGSSFGAVIRLQV